MKNHNLFIVFRVSVPWPPAIFEVTPVSKIMGLATSGFMIQFLWFGVSIYAIDNTIDNPHL